MRRRRTGCAVEAGKSAGGADSGASAKAENEGRERAWLFRALGARCVADDAYGPKAGGLAACVRGA
jgi:hypothetical protein